MRFFDWFRGTKKASIKPLTVKAEVQTLDFAELDRYWNKKLSGDLLGPRVVDNNYRDISNFEVAKLALNSYLKSELEIEKGRAERAGRAPDYQAILYAAYEINRDLEGGKLKGISRDGGRVSRNEGQMSTQSFNDLTSQFKSRFAEHYPKDSDKTSKAIPPKLKSGTTFGGFFGATSSMHTAIYNLFKQCVPQPQLEKGVERKLR